MSTKLQILHNSPRQILHRSNCVIYYTKRNQPKGKTMFDLFKDTDKKLQELAAQVKQVNDFWIDSIISSLKQFQKTK